MSTLTNLKAMLLSWNTTTFQSTLLDIVLYAFIGALCLWFLIALYYNFRNNRVKKRSQQRINGIEQERAQLSESLEATTQQLSQSKHQLTQSEQALTLKQQRIEELEDAVKLAQVKINHGLALESQITAALTTLPTDFFASAEPSTENISSWQRYHSAVNDLIVRLQTYAQDQLQLQQEKNQLNAALHEQALTIKTLQQKEIATDAQISQLEQIIDDTQALLHEQQTKFDTHKRPSTTSNQPSTPLTEPSVIETVADDNVLESKAHQAEDIVVDDVSGLKSAFQPAATTDQPVTQPAPTMPTPVAAPVEAAVVTQTVTISPAPMPTVAKTTTPASTSSLKKMFSFGKKSAPAPATKTSATPAGKTVPPVTKAVPKTPATSPLQAKLSTSNTKDAASTQPAAKGKSFFGFFNKEAISDYIEAALEKNDALVAEETLKESLTEDQASTIKPKSLWQKISFSKK